jgi:hypothetical protein
MFIRRYYATFAPGLEEPVEAIVKERLPGVKIQKLLEGAVIFETSTGYDRFDFCCFNNIFAVVSILEAPGPERALENHIRFLCSRRKTEPVIAENADLPAKARSFRIICSLENRLTAVDEKTRAAAERYIAERSGLAVNRSRPGAEFWFLYRREGFSICMKRLTRRGSFEKTLHPGELPPPLAYTLCRLSEPRPADIVADPFCGYGSILEQRVKHFPLARFYASDIDRRAVDFARKKITGPLLDRCHIRRIDMRDIFSVIPEGSVDRIITDPPWGMYAETPVPIGQFYGDMIAVFGRLLKRGGAAVVLTARGEELTQAAEQSGVLSITKVIPILVSGKKARVTLLRRE